MNSNIIFIHVPKVAGSSMEAREFIGGGGHQKIRFFRRAVQLSFIGLDYNRFFKFAFVRNPYDRAMSAIVNHYLGTGEQDQMQSEKSYEKSAKGVEQFLTENFEKIKNLDNHRHWVHLIPQYKFLTFYKGEDIALSWHDGEALDFIGRFENLKNDWKFVCDKVGVSDELPHIRNDEHLDLRSFMTLKSKKMLSEIYAKDFDLYNYQREL
jgi:hypothetical protein